VDHEILEKKLVRKCSSKSGGERRKKDKTLLYREGVRNTSPLSGKTGSFRRPMGTTRFKSGQSLREMAFRS